MPTIDHPLLEAERVMASGWLDPDVIDRAVVEWRGGPQTAQRLRESVFELLGWKGRVPVAIESIVEPEFALETLGVECWAAIGVIDDSSVLRLADGRWFGIGQVDETADREMVLFRLTEEQDAEELRALLAEGRKPVWAIDATRLVPMGSERFYRAVMAGEVPID